MFKVIFSARKPLCSYYHHVTTNRMSCESSVLVNITWKKVIERVIQIKFWKWQTRQCDSSSFVALSTLLCYYFIILRRWWKGKWAATFSAYEFLIYIVREVIGVVRTLKWRPICILYWMWEFDAAHITICATLSTWSRLLLFS